VEKNPTDVVYATTRNPADSEDLQRLARGSDGHVVVVQLDMVDEDSIKVSVCRNKELLYMSTLAVLTIQRTQ
jgi:hypothetical protein